MQDCIVGENLYRNTIDCIVTEAGHGLYCNTVTGPRHGVGRRWGMQQAREAQARRGRARGARAACSWASGLAGARDTGTRAQRARDNRRGRGARAREVRAAQALGALPGRAGWPWLCTRCIRPVFSPV